MKILRTIRNYLHKPLITGTLLLTAAGVLSRIIGFFYRIFLSRTIGVESLGLYQLTFPVLALCMSLTSSGIQTALSRFVAEERHCPRRAFGYFYLSLLLSCTLSVICAAVVIRFREFLAVTVLGDVRCAPILFIMTFTLVPTCIHACINGYYFGLKKAGVPSASQLMEQLARVGGVYLIYTVKVERRIALTASDAMWGIVIGELMGMLYSLTALWLGQSLRHGTRTTDGRQGGGAPTDSGRLSYRRGLMLLCGMAVPLTFNRVLINLCTSIENLLIPRRLLLFGMTQSEALSVYGTLTGMAMSIILFPNVLTGSLSVLLLPAVSEANAGGREASIISATQKAVRWGLLLGLSFTLVFFLGGDLLGTVIFDSPLAGSFIRRLSWLCPMMYVSGMLGSILHGLGRPKTVLLINLLSCLMRIFFVYTLVPHFGINAYLWSLLLSQLFCAVACMLPLRRYLLK